MLIVVIGTEVTPRRRAVIVALRHGIAELGVKPVPLRKIAATIGVPKSTCDDIYKHALKNATAKRDAAKDSGDSNAGDTSNPSPTVLGQGSEELEVLSLSELLSADCLDPDPAAHAGRSAALSKEEIDHLIATTKKDWGTRHMTLTELQRESGLHHVCRSTIFNALQARNIGAYVEEKKFILNEDNKKRRMVSGPDRTILELSPGLGPSTLRKPQ